jgi:Tfp pilus assembly protein PilV
MTSTTNIRTRRPGAAGGFTLAEVLISALLMGLGFLALVAAYGHDTTVTKRGEEVASATYLADEIRDKALQMNFTDVLALNNITYNPAILSTGTANGQAQWSQYLTVTPVAQGDLNAAVGSAGAQAARLTVEVRSLGKRVTAQTYYIFKMDGVPFTSGGG